MLKIFLVIALLFSVGLGNAQVSFLDAKAAYQLAEESYDKGAMHAALQYLDDAADKLGTTNAKILYLKVIILKELAAKDTSYDAKLDTALAHFERTHDAADFNEEKTLEIIKIKLQRKQLKGSDQRFEQGLAEFQKRTGWILGTNSDSLRQQRKDLFETQQGKNYVTESKAAGIIAHFTDATMKTQLDEIYITKDTVVGFTKYFYTLNETGSFEKTASAESAALEDLKDMFSFVPEPVVKTVENGTTTTYSWPVRSLIKVTAILVRVSSNGYSASRGFLILTKL